MKKFVQSVMTIVLMVGLLHRTVLLQKASNRLGQLTISRGIWMDNIRLEKTIVQHDGQGLLFARDLHFCGYVPIKGFW
jgi:hypothetical protein